MELAAPWARPRLTSISGDAGVAFLDCSTIPSAVARSAVSAAIPRLSLVASGAASAATSIFPRREQRCGRGHLYFCRRQQRCERGHFSTFSSSASPLARPLSAPRFDSTSPSCAHLGRVTLGEAALLGHLWHSIACSRLVTAPRLRARAPVITARLAQDWRCACTLSLIGAATLSYSLVVSGIVGAALPHLYLRRAL